MEEPLEKWKILWKMPLEKNPNKDFVVVGGGEVIKL